jgi:hypothetical protein
MEIKKGVNKKRQEEKKMSARSDINVCDRWRRHFGLKSRVASGLQKVGLRFQVTLLGDGEDFITFILR